MSPYVKLLIIIFAIMMVILSGFGLYNLIKQQTVKRWPNNKVYEFKDLSVHDSSVDEGDHLKTSN